MEANEILHEIDPDGDIELILHNPNAPIAVWVQEHETALKPSSDPTESPRTNGSTARPSATIRGFSILSIKAKSKSPPCRDDPASNTQQNQETTHRFRLSSKHLTLASIYFKKMLQGPWKESRASTIEAHDWDPDAMVILMNVIHGRHRSVPKTVDIEKLANIAVLVDYYGCHEVVELFAEKWATNVEGAIPKQYCRQLVLWLAVGHMFSRANAFLAATRSAIMYSTGPIQTLDLPIPQQVVDTIEQRRQVAVEGIIARLHDLTLYFSEYRTKCSFECASLLLGALTKQLQVHGLFNPSPTKPFIGYSPAGLLSTINDFVSPKSSDMNASSQLHRCSCQLRTFLEGFNSLARDEIRGMDLIA
ncbi:hypothetical protein PG991_015983 [Apiospora marii]|uniref:BTB domain-containing protein n=1 Tax=Apiospora marii TaxID=335849 RepID=A0ABR1R114_9PEZI